MQPSARDLDLRQRHGVETPEHVDVHFELAGIGSRLAAALLDLLFMLLALLMLALVFDAVVGQTGKTARGWLAALMLLLVFFLVWGYFTLFEALNGGRTPGKQALAAAPSCAADDLPPPKQQAAGRHSGGDDRRS
ncbi:MAG: hypothetical protein AUI08_04265 [Gemmatimonadetes bacterium 13_2_20CM_2_65_7]|nr:MAG: hypothetical protein AUI08_04265 [Gemmatimonadetes bacterium 13_2_20CM_2_65_7]